MVLKDIFSGIQQNRYFNFIFSYRFIPSLLVALFLSLYVVFVGSGWMKFEVVFLVSFLSSFLLLREGDKIVHLSFLVSFICFVLLFYVFIFQLEKFLVLSGEKLVFAVPFLVIPSVLFFIVEKRFALYISALCSFLLFFVHRNFHLSFIHFTVSFALIELLKGVRRRIVMFKLGVICGFIGSVLALFLERDIVESSLFFLSSIFSPFVSLGIIYIAERFFGVLTPFYLFDLQDLEHPLLVQLRKRAPGTFHHSLVVSDIAYVVASELGVNAELVRCAALYHDIGKITRPAYFIENTGGESRHFKITPPLSAKIVVKHVEDGVKIAESYMLPKRIIDFIREHHGTTNPEFFIKAAEMLDIDFSVRYPGPTPRSIETVIMMIADSCEAAVRSLEDYSLDEIRRTVEKVVKNKMEQGQFDYAPVTLEQISRIKEGIIKALADFYHIRVSYEEEEIKDYIITIRSKKSGKFSEGKEEKLKKTEQVSSADGVKNDLSDGRDKSDDKEQSDVISEFSDKSQEKDNPKKQS